jgi:hypothetical protein
MAAAMGAVAGQWQQQLGDCWAMAQQHGAELIEEDGCFADYDLWVFL